MRKLIRRNCFTESLFVCNLFCSVVLFSSLLSAFTCELRLSFQIYAWTCNVFFAFIRNVLIVLLFVWNFIEKKTDSPSILHIHEFLQQNFKNKSIVHIVMAEIQAAIPIWPGSICFSQIMCDVICKSFKDINTFL